MSNTPQHPPPGWYPDPTGRPVQRYWDGRQWVGPEQPAATQGALSAPQGPWWQRWWILVPAALMVVFILAAIGSAVSELGDEGDDAELEPVADAQGGDDEPGAGEATDEPEPQETDELEELSEDEQLAALITDHFAGENNRDLPYLRDVSVVEQVDGGWGVFVEIHAQDNMTTNMIRRGIERDMVETYEALYTSGVDVRAATVTAYFPLVDQYGQSSEEAVYKTILDIDEAERVNWDNPHAVDWDQVWTVSLLHQAFEE